jgi:hypothetical protein
MKRRERGKKKKQEGVNVRGSGNNYVMSKPNHHCI